ncbi:MAG TPA: glycoside hydrolase family 65 protein [Firmicutes bacterium]|uniref:Glycoside hydrolase family 65 protein n=1 Tax=Capillibacterium thermochitinicola TaxID=2699427 RepID=A0A8J6I147_9FIRM|nr:family 65 glycosyl hydrolase domain-containing protein [Capillibacterium thermochitinicola]MBA2133526.1 glycoside hydrolase family 65 protein [Capillibacterium thermochitinicola]HHW13095.1 glycoside hydrolase family 65 protein [Bacillota bacterium]
MTHRFIDDEWKIIEEGFAPEESRFTESIFTLGNEHMGLRGFFEERYTGDSLPGIYLAGVYYPDKTKVGWWKNGYPEYFAKVINSTNWIGIDIEINGIPLDLATSKFRDFRRELDMKNGRLTRSFVWTGPRGEEIVFTFTRFLSMTRKNIACLAVEVNSLNFNGVITLLPYLDGDVTNEDANYGEKFWTKINQELTAETALLTMETKKTGFRVATAMATALHNRHPETPLPAKKELCSAEELVGYRYSVPVTAGARFTLHKLVAVCTSRDFAKADLETTSRAKLAKALADGYDLLYEEHRAKLHAMWEEYDVVITGDIRAQQGIRYCIFQLLSTYAGSDPRLNIGPKGFSGEKYGGVVYWDTEAFCFPFYLYTNAEIAKNLLFFRYRQLDKAKENAAKLGLKGALYPMVTIDGTECHNEWEITFEEIHRNGAIAYAIHNYTRYTGDQSYLLDYGLEILVEISRFWADRVTYHPRKDCYMILGVTGPNEYENNVNNNWYTNLMAAWTLTYTIDSLNLLQTENQAKYAAFIDKTGLTAEELNQWRTITEKMYYPYVEELGIFEQNDLYMDKELQVVADLPPSELPLNKHWSWDRILRSCFIKQADVVQGLYFFPEKFDRETVRRNFDFYEPRTVHESSLSPSVHSIVASRIGYKDKAYALYLRTARLDLDNYNADTDDGIHLTSMAGSWTAIVEGFAGLAVRNDRLTLAPYLPGPWTSYSFKITFRGRKLRITVDREQVSVQLLAGAPLTIVVYDDEVALAPDFCRTLKTR